MGGLPGGSLIGGAGKPGPEMDVAFFRFAFNEACLPPRDQFLKVREIYARAYVRVHTHTHFCNSTYTVFYNRGQVLSASRTQEEA